MKRRNVLAGLAIAAAGLATGAAWKFLLFCKHYPRTPYDDLLGQIVDREPATLFGRAAAPSFPAAPILAADLRRDGHTLSTRAASEPAAGRVQEVDGWLVPQSVAQYAALAALALPPAAP
jgi:hypothetical protein